MAKIMQSSTLRNKYHELSEFCNENSEAVFITKNGEGDLAVMSITHYEEILGRMELYSQLMVGLKAASEGRVKSINEVEKELGL
ncbi:MAG: type II toxin-antitoxin system prevent-host-death family antitoxin [Deferribacteraceae bacterium]|nr:type II toxin-antitoxin system prevent-host-death family antitoxin [Deferribacteraceae bacterium]